MIDFPVYYPTRLAPGLARSPRTRRAFPIDGPDKDVYYGYKMVVDVPATLRPRLHDEFYGVSGTDWVDAPILYNPCETRTIDGKRLPAVLRRRPAAAGRLEDHEGRLLGQQHPAAVARRGPDALDRDLDARVRIEVASRARGEERKARRSASSGSVGSAW